MRGRTFRAHMDPMRAPTAPNRLFPISYDMRDEEPPRSGAALHAEERGGCDACVFVSIAHESFGPGIIVLTRDGETRGPISSQDLFFAWLEITRELAERPGAHGFDGPRRDFVTKVWSIAEHAMRERRVEIRGLGAKGEN